MRENENTEEKKNNPTKTQRRAEKALQTSGNPVVKLIKLERFSSIGRHAHSIASTHSKPMTEKQPRKLHGGIYEE